MPLPFEGDPALLGQLLVGVSEVDQERRRRQDRKQERSLLVALPAVFGTLQRHCVSGRQEFTGWSLHVHTADQP